MMDELARDIKAKVFHLYGLLWGGYLLLLLLFVGISISLDVRREETRFDESAYFFQSYFETLINRNLIALHGFAALLQVEGDRELDKISAYSRFVLANHPYIYMMEIARKVLQEDMDSFIAKQREVGFAEFQPKTFSFEGGREWRPVSAKPIYYPLVFMEPLLPESRDLLGLDLDSVSFLRDALQRSLETNGVVASRPFRLVEGEMGYLLIRPVEHNGKNLFALIVCKASNLLPPPMPDQDRLSVGIYYQGHRNGQEDAWLIRQPARVQDDGLASRIFPKLSVTRPVGGREQPFMIKVERQLDWHIINLNMIAVILSGGLAVLLLLLAYARAHHSNEMKRLEVGNTLFYRANFDSLTGLANRELFLNRLEQALVLANRQGGKHAVLYLDLDGFKSINDYYGHSIGDKVLQRAARIFLRCVREIDTVARLGGDEFVILLHNVDNRAGAEYVARKIKRAFRQPSSESSKLLPMIGTSVGIAVYPEDGKSAMELLKAADLDMYQDKGASRPREDLKLDSARQI